MPLDPPSSPLVVISDAPDAPEHVLLRAGQTALIERSRAFLHVGQNENLGLTLDQAITSLKVANAADVASHDIRIDGPSITHVVRFLGRGRFTVTFDALGNMMFAGEAIAWMMRGCRLEIGRLGNGRMLER